MGSWRSVLLVVAAVALVAVLASVQGSQPHLLVDASVGSDFEVLALETWDRFVAVFRARSHCFSDVTLRAARSLDSRAGYDPDTATATVHVPGTRAMLQSALVHEFAHHVEFQCGEHLALRPAFIAALGLAPETPWRPDALPAQIPASLWASIPSELYAESAVVLVLDTRRIPTRARVTEEMVRVIGRWASGEASTEGGK